MPSELQLELLVGRVVHDTNGRRVGRIEDVRAEIHDGELLAPEFVVGVRGVLERMALSFSSMFVGISGKVVAVPWELMDLSDAKSPRLRCTLEELEKRSA